MTLTLTPEILFVISHDDDVQQQAFAVAELECGVKLGETTVLTIIWRDSYTEKLDEVSQHLSHLMRKPTMRFPNRSDTNQAVQSQKQVNILQFRI